MQQVIYFKLFLSKEGKGAKKKKGKTKQNKKNVHPSILGDLIINYNKQ